MLLFPVMGNGWQRGATEVAWVLRLAACGKTTSDGATEALPEGGVTAWATGGEASGGSPDAANGGGPSGGVPAGGSGDGAAAAGGAATGGAPAGGMPAGGTVTGGFATGSVYLDALGDAPDLGGDLLEAQPYAETNELVFQLRFASDPLTGT